MEMIIYADGPTVLVTCYIYNPPWIEADKDIRETLGLTRLLCIYIGDRRIPTLASTRRFSCDQDEK